MAGKRHADDRSWFDLEVRGSEFLDTRLRRRFAGTAWARRSRSPVRTGLRLRLRTGFCPMTASANTISWADISMRAPSVWRPPLVAEQVCHRDWRNRIHPVDIRCYAREPTQARDIAPRQDGESPWASGPFRVPYAWDGKKSQALGMTSTAAPSGIPKATVRTNRET